MREAASALELRDVEKHYGGLRPLRVRDLRIPSLSRTTLIGFDQAAAETFMNLTTGAVLPEKGEVRSFGQSTSTIPDGDAWLAFVERFGFVSNRIVLLEGLNIAQNLAIPFGLQLDPIPADVLGRVASLADEVQIDRRSLESPVAGANATLRAKVWLARALALEPEMLLLEHPTAAIPPDEVKELGTLLGGISERRRLTTIALTVDEKFGKALGGRLLTWQPATGEFRERRSWF